MSFQIYQYMHHLGLALALISLGGLGAMAMLGQAQSKARTPFVALHGTGLLLLLVGGMGWLHKGLGGGFPIWVIFKIVIWLGLGAIIVPMKRKVGLAKTLAVVVVPALAATAAALGVFHGQIFGN